MSVIHEALKRAERDRAAGHVEKAAFPTPTPAPPRRHPTRIVAALGVILLFLAGAYWLRHGDRSRTAPSGPKVAAVDTSPSPQPTGRPAVLRPAEPRATNPAAAPAVAPAANPGPAQLNTQAVVSFREGRPAEAQRLLEQALRLAPAMPEAHNNLGMVLHALGQRTAAKEKYRRALALLPVYPEALNNLGLAWSDEGNQDEAIRCFENALAAKPDYSSAHLNLAIVYDKLGKRSDAFHHYRRFLENAKAGEQELVRRVNDRLRR